VIRVDVLLKLLQCAKAVLVRFLVEVAEQAANLHLREVGSSLIRIHLYLDRSLGLGIAIYANVTMSAAPDPRR
jgi:hypothetical protein